MLHLSGNVKMRRYNLNKETEPESLSFPSLDILSHQAYVLLFLFFFKLMFFLRKEYLASLKLKKMNSNSNI